MTRTIVGSAMVLGLTLATLPGCSAGRENVLFMTKSNIGMDIDSKPPTSELSIARRELVIAPTFAGGKTPPVAASFRSARKGIVGLFSSIDATFAGGAAASTMTRWLGDLDDKEPNNIQSGTLCLLKKPTNDQLPSWLTGKVQMPGPDEVYPFVFGTDTSFGLKLAWSGITAQVPDTAKLGYNRKEMAWAPVFIKEEPCKEEEKTPDGKEVVRDFSVNIPSFLATIDTNVTVGEAADIASGTTGAARDGAEVIQYFATGSAANNLALKSAIRQVMLERLDPEASRLLRYASGQGKQFGGIRTIAHIYDEADMDKKTRIKKKAKDLGLVADDSADDTRWKKLLARSAKPDDSTITDKIEQLETFVKSLP